MDWALAIERNSVALRGIVATLFAMLGLLDGASVARIPRALHRAVLRLLRPAESAVRRLIVVAARGLVVKLVSSRAMPARPVGKGNTRGKSFQLFDTRKNFNRQRRRKGKRLVPRIHVLGCDPTVAALWQSQRPSPAPAPAPPPDGRVDAARLARRLHALKSALEDLPRQAKRLARWRLKRANMKSPKFTSPLRPGYAPGHRQKKTHEVDEVLTECHWLAFEALKFDTS
jgi:hypothetical protein